MRRACPWVFLALLTVPAAAALGQGSAFDDALGHAMQRYFASRLPEAHGELTELIRLGLPDPRPHYFRGLCAWQSGRTADARRDFARGAELEQANPQRSPEVGTALTRVQGPGRRTLEGYRANVRMALYRQRDAERLAHYGLDTNQPPGNLLASAAPRGAGAQPAAAPPDAAANAPAAPAVVQSPAEKPADDPFAAPPASDKPASPAAGDPFAAPPGTPASQPPPAAAMPAQSPSADAPAATADTSTPDTSTPDTSTPDGTVAAAIAALDKPQDLWALLPASYQADIKGIINEFGAKMDAELWNRVFAVLNKLVRVGKEKRDLILKQPALAAMPVPGGKEELTQNWDRIMEFASTLLGSEVSTVEGLKSLDPPAFLAGTGSALVKLIREAPPSSAATDGNVSLAQLRAAKISIVKAEGDTATLSMTVEGKPPAEFMLKRVDGKWLPTEMADGWAAKMGMAKLGLGQMNVAAQKPQAMLMLQMADGVLEQLLAAKDEAAFNAALAPIMALIGQFGGMPPGTPPPAAPPP